MPDPGIRLAPLSPEDGEEVMSIFNYYVDNSFAAYPDTKLPAAFFDHILAMCDGYPTVAAKDASGKTIGFGMLRPYNPMATFRHTAEVTYFLSPEQTGRGIGGQMLDYLIDEAKKMGVRAILASISSKNDISLAFHAKQGFTECGRLREVGYKLGHSFDVVYMQRMV